MAAKIDPVVAAAKPAACGHMEVLANASGAVT
jgi:hypothetical protein